MKNLKIFVFMCGLLNPVQNFSMFDGFVNAAQVAWEKLTDPRDPEVKDLTEFGIVVLTLMAAHSHLFPEKPQGPIPRNISSFEAERFAQEQQRLVDRATSPIQPIKRTDSSQSDQTEKELEFITSSGLFRHVDSSGSITESPAPNRGTPPGWVDVAQLIESQKK